MPRKLHLAVAVYGVGGPGQHGLWKDPRVPKNASVDMNYYIRLAQIADAGGLTDAQHRESLELFQAQIAPVLRRGIPDPPWPWGPVGIEHPVAEPRPAAVKAAGSVLCTTLRIAASHPDGSKAQEDRCVQAEHAEAGPRRQR